MEGQDTTQNAVARDESLPKSTHEMSKAVTGRWEIVLVLISFHSVVGRASQMETKAFCFGFLALRERMPAAATAPVAFTTVYSKVLPAFLPNLCVCPGPRRSSNVSLGPEERWQGRTGLHGTCTPGLCRFDLDLD